MDNTHVTPAVEATRATSTFDAVRCGFLAKIASSVAWACLFAGCASPAGEADFTGVKRFWTLTEALQGDRIPAAADWDGLFATPGYATLKAHGGSDRLLREALPLALLPSLAGERDAADEQDYVAGIVVEHLRRAVALRSELESFMESLRGQDLMLDAVLMARSWLPGEATRAEPPEVSFVLLEPDARGYERVVIDLLLAYDLNETALTPLLAHETHHVLREAFTVVLRPEGNFAEKDLLASLDNLQAEGIADLIDKSDYLGPKTWGEQPTERLFAAMHERYVDAYGRAKESLSRTDAFLAAYARDPESARAIGRELRASLELGGHPVGFYMARTILEAFGRERLIENVGDPFAFMMDYSEAASRLGDGRHVFSEEALAGVRALRRKLVP